MAHRVKIAARLRPRLQGELHDEGVWIVRSEDLSGGAASAICVTNPRDQSQVFRFPCVFCALCPLIVEDSIAVLRNLTHRITRDTDSFTSCYDETSTQEDIFENDVRPLIDVVFSGVVSLSVAQPLLWDLSCRCPLY